MPEYELTFIVDYLDLDSEEMPLEAEFTDDVMVGRNHSGDYYASVTVEADSAINAARDAHMRLCRHGVTVDRLEYDLADRREIAFRLGQTRQAVGHWIRGDRRSGVPFPKPFNDVGGGVWLWADVVTWVREVRGDDPMDGIDLPTRHEIVEFNAEVGRQYARRSDSGSRHERVFTVLLDTLAQARQDHTRGVAAIASDSTPDGFHIVDGLPKTWDWFEQTSAGSAKFVKQINTVNLDA